MKKVEQSWKIVMVLLLVATAASIIKSRPISVRGFDATGALSYKVDPDWPTLPPGRPEPKRLQRRIGYMHGDVAVASNGEVYVSVQNMWYVKVYLDGKQANADMGLGPEYLDPYAGLQVYAPDGSYLRNVPGAPTDLHGFIINKDITANTFTAFASRRHAPPDQTKADWYHQGVEDDARRQDRAVHSGDRPGQVQNQARWNVVHAAVRTDCGSNGDIYVTDGYASDYIHRFDKTGKSLTRSAANRSRTSSARCTSTSTRDSIPLIA
jgi:hypothetical protein